jgi:copper chaperone CopZ
MIMNEWLPRHWFTQFLSAGHDAQHLHFLPSWLKTASGVLLIALIINGYVQRWFSTRKIKTVDDKDLNVSKMAERVVKVSGMTCNHCKTNVEKNLSTIEGIEQIEVDLPSSSVRIKGDHIDLKKIKDTVEGIGYEYLGEAI